MRLALNFLLTILVELPIIAVFFKRRKRQHALAMAFLINIISWAVAHIVFFTTDLNTGYTAIVLGIAEAVAFNRLMECNWKKAIIMSLIVNTLSFYITRLVPRETFPSKPDVIKTVWQKSPYNSY